MEPHGRALAAYFTGDRSVHLILRRDDGVEMPIPVSHFFRSPSEFTPIENAALELCSGPVFDIGAGSGLHSLVLQERGADVTAIDISPHAVSVAASRAVVNVSCADIFDYGGGPFDTMLLLGHGIGMVETLGGLDRFLARAGRLLSDHGQVLLDSLDVRVTNDERNLAYHEANRRAGRYIGEIRIQMEFGGHAGPWCGWLQVDPATLEEHAAARGWRCAVITQLQSGDYLARLIRR